MGEEYVTVSGERRSLRQIPTLIPLWIPGASADYMLYISQSLEYHV
jgi:hypothetical protein